MKKNIFIFLLFLVNLPSIAAGNNAAPYTEEALNKINKVTQETPKLALDRNKSPEEYHKQLVEHFSKIFETAGYSYTDTIDMVVNDMKNKPEAIPADRPSVYNKIYMLLHIMMYECNFDKVDCLQFYPPATGQSIQWFLENSAFSKQDIDSHFKGAH